jgi:hypothetical protein
VRADEAGEVPVLRTILVSHRIFTFSSSKTQTFSSVFSLFANDPHFAAIGLNEGLRFTVTWNSLLTSG